MQIRKAFFLCDTNSICINLLIISLYHIPHFSPELLEKIWNSQSVDYVKIPSTPLFSIFIHKDLLLWYASILINITSSLVCH